jgi:nitrite reductase/ring-hydroxylating ferredoxin subunit
MLNQQENEVVTRIGPGTLMGSLMREYWVPAMLSSELPSNDCPPVRVMLLGEPLIGWRDSNGKIGLVANNCPHRGASLYFGRNEDCGLRCVYHGWKFDVEGNCIDMPNEPAESNFKNKVKVTAYPCAEQGGIIWTYMGSRSVPPPLPSIEASLLPEDRRRATSYMRPCNWLQALEGDIDTVHAAFLHGGASEPEDFPEGTFGHYEVKQRAPRFVSVDTDYGAVYGAYRPAMPGHHYWRIGQFMMPFWTEPPPGLLGHKITSTAWVPMDDEHTMVYGVSATDRPAFADGRRPQAAGPARQEFYGEGSSDWFGRFPMAQNEANDYMMDRREQAIRSSYTGIPGGAVPQDTAVQVGMGVVFDRSIEHLGTSDIMIIRVRNRLLHAARAFAEHRTAPPGVDDPEKYAVRSGGTFLPVDVNWLDGIKDLVQGFVDHPELDVAVVGPSRPTRPLSAGAGERTER